MNAAGFAGVNRVLLESYLSALSVISPRTYRLGSGREEADGAVSFLVRFVGREQGITGELYVRLQEQPSEPPVAEGAPEAVEGTSPVEGTGEAEGAVEAARPPARRVWVFEELILDEPRSRESEDRETQHRFDFSPYERFF
jgi:hypothetical protein